MRDDLVQQNLLVCDHPDRRGPTVRSKMGSANVEGLGVSDYGPVDCCGSGKDRVF
jgi:hypothetical protein